MRSFLGWADDTARSLALLYLLASLAPAIFDPTLAREIAGLSAGGRTVIWGAALVVMASFVHDIARAVGAFARAIRAGWRASARLLPRRGLVGRWVQLTFREPLAPPDQAREALATLCGYRLRGSGYRIVSLRPSIRALRFGVRVTVAGPSKFSRSWECRYVRRVEDPHELWLIRSALRAVESTGERVPSESPEAAIGSPDGDGTGR